MKFNLMIAVTFAALAIVLSALHVRWTKRLVIDRAADRMRQDINAAWQIVEDRQSQIETIVRFLADACRTETRPTATQGSDAPGFAEARDRWGLTFLDDLDSPCWRTGDPPDPIAAFLVDSFIAEGPLRPLSGVAVVPAEVMAEAGPAFARQCTVGEKTLPGMVLFAATPHPTAPGGPRRLLVGGVLLNGSTHLVDEIQQALFKEAFYKGKRVGTATFFAGPVRIATTVLLADGRPATGTVVSREVEEQVLEKGVPWAGRAKVVDTWYISRYDPIRDPAGKIVGMLYIGELEQPYLDIQLKTLLVGIGVILAVMAAAFLVSFVISNRMLAQISALEDGARLLAGGDLSVRAPVTTRDEIGGLARAFNAMAEKIEADRDRIVLQKATIEEANRSYIDLLSFVTHELRGCLAGAILNVKLMEEGSFGPLDDRVAEGVGIISDTLVRLNDLTLNYLQLSRIEAGRMLLDRAAVRLVADVIAPVLADLASEIDRTHMSIDVNVPEDLFVNADRDLLRIVYHNLLTNAAKFGRHGGRIVLDAKVAEGSVTASVWNDGPGIRQDRLDEVFKKFRHFDVGDEQGKTGTGVGLFIVQKIIDEHGGRISVDSKENEYACFSFSLPA